MLARTLTLLLALPLIAVPALGQVVATVSGDAGVTHRGFTSDNLGLGAGASIALPPAAHLAPFWNLLDGGFDRAGGYNGGSVATSLGLWIAADRNAASGHGAVLLLESGVGRRWGVGVAGFTEFGAGAGWNFAGKLPYVEIRRRASFHSGQPAGEEIVVGVHWVIFG